MTARRPASLVDVVAGDEVAVWMAGSARPSYEVVVVDRTTTAMIEASGRRFNRQGRERGRPHEGMRCGPVTDRVVAEIAQVERERRASRSSCARHVGENGWSSSRGPRAAIAARRTVRMREVYDEVPTTTVPVPTSTTVTVGVRPPGGLAWSGGDAVGAGLLGAACLIAGTAAARARGRRRRVR